MLYLCTTFTGALSRGASQRFSQNSRERKIHAAGERIVVFLSFIFPPNVMARVPLGLDWRITAITLDADLDVFIFWPIHRVGILLTVRVCPRAGRRSDSIWMCTQLGGKKCHLSLFKRISHRRSNESQPFEPLPHRQHVRGRGGRIFKAEAWKTVLIIWDETKQAATMYVNHQRHQHIYVLTYIIVHDAEGYEDCLNNYERLSL